VQWEIREWLPVVIEMVPLTDKTRS